MKIRQAIQIGDNVTDVMKLPCVVACIKQDDKQGYRWLMYRIMVGAGGRAEYGEKGDWICQGYNGRWCVMTDDEYKNQPT